VTRSASRVLFDAAARTVVDRSMTAVAPRFGQADLQRRRPAELPLTHATEPFQGRGPIVDLTDRPISLLTRGSNVHATQLTMLTETPLFQ